MNIFATDGSRADVAAKIVLASDGDEVTIPSGSFTWTSGVSLGGKAVHLRGQGAGRVVARSQSSVAVGTGAKSFTLVTEKVASIAALRNQLTEGTSVRIWRTGGAVSGGVPTGSRPWMLGTVTSVVGSTLTVDVTSTNGTGTHPLWIIAVEPVTRVVLNASSTSSVTVTESTAGNAEISGIRFEHDIGLSADVDHKANFIYIIRATNGKPALIHDCFFLNYTYGDQVYSNSNRGIVWDCSCVSLPYSTGPLAFHLAAPGITDSWTTVSNMGTDDSAGDGKFFVEDCDFHAWLNVTDFDDNSRTVVRNCLFNNSGWGSHGADSSNYGLRHFELYDNEFIRNNYSDGQTLNLNWFVLLRGGTGVISDNYMSAMDGSDYGGYPQIRLALWNLQFNAGPNPLWGKNIEGVQYHCPRQIGFGRVTGNGVDGKARSTDSVTYVGDSEPLYIWGNTGTATVSLSQYSTPASGEDLIADYLQAGRDYYNNGTAKPSYVKNEYPHPLRTDLGPASPSDLTATVNGPSFVALSWTDNSSDETGFKIERSTDGSAWSQIATVGAGVTSYTDTGLAGGTLYYYRVRAYNDNGNSAYSNTASDTTDAEPILVAGIHPNKELLVMF